MFRSWLGIPKRIIARSCQDHADIMPKSCPNEAKHANVMPNLWLTHAQIDQNHLKSMIRMISVTPIGIIIVVDVLIVVVIIDVSRHSHCHCRRAVWIGPWSVRVEVTSFAIVHGNFFIVVVYLGRALQVWASGCGSLYHYIKIITCQHQVENLLDIISRYSNCHRRSRSHYCCRSWSFSLVLS